MSLKIKAELGGDGTGFERMMTKAGATANNFATHTMGGLKSALAGAFAVGAIERLSKSTIDYASHLRDVSDDLGVNVELLQEMGYAAKLTGGSLEDVEKFSAHMAKARAEALGNPQGAAMGAFKKFGFSAGDVQTMPFKDMINQMSKAIQEGNQQELLPAFQAIGGKGAEHLVGAFLAGIEAMAAQAREAGAIIPEDTIDQLDEIGDRLQTWGVKIKVTVAPLILKAVKALDEVFTGFKETFVAIVAFLKKFDFTGVLAAMGKTGAGDDSGWADVKKNFRDAADAAKEAGAAVAKQHSEDEKHVNAAMDAQRAARHRRETGPIAFTPLAGGSAEKFQFARNSDALTSVGNFLGGTGAAADLVSVGEKTNRLLQDANTHLGNISNKIGGTYGSSGIPEE